jgi:hypothetical protein
MGFEDKTDEIDVQVIRDMALTRPTLLKIPTVRLFDDPLVTRLSAANQELMLLRRTENMVPNKSKLGFKTVTDKDRYADTLIAELPAFDEQPEARQIALGSGEYAKVLIAAAGKATKYSESRADFEHFTGLFAHGYPSQIRSDVHHWRWRFARKHEITLSEFRRECRWLYHHLKESKGL